MPNFCPMHRLFVKKPCPGKLDDRIIGIGTRKALTDLQLGTNSM